MGWSAENHQCDICGSYEIEGYLEDDNGDNTIPICKLCKEEE